MPENMNEPLEATTLEQFKLLVKGMKSVYTSEKFLPDADSVRIWHRLLRDIPYEVLSVSIQRHMMTEKFAPTVADIRKLATETVQGDTPEWSEGWQEVQRAIHKYGSYEPDKAMEMLSPLTRKVVKQMGFMNICMSETPAVERANFRMIYERLVEREKELAQISAPVMQLINQITTKMDAQRRLEAKEGNSP